MLNPCELQGPFPSDVPTRDVAVRATVDPGDENEVTGIPGPVDPTLRTDLDALGPVRLDRATTDIQLSLVRVRPGDERTGAFLERNKSTPALTAFVFDVRCLKAQR